MKRKVKEKKMRIVTLIPLAAIDNTILTITETTAS